MILDFTMLFIWLLVFLGVLMALPWIIYCVSWLAGRAWYAGRLSAIRSAFKFTGRKKCEKRKPDSDTKSVPKKT